MNQLISIVEKEIDKKFHEQTSRKNSYASKASLAVATQALILNVAANVYLSMENVNMGYFNFILALAAIGIACAGYTVLAPKYEYDAPNIEKILNEYKDLKCDMTPRSEEEMLRLQEKIMQAKAKTILYNEKMEKTNIILMSASFACMLLELIVMLLMK